LVIRDAGDLEKATEKFKSSLAAMRKVGGDVLVKAADLVDVGFDNLQSGHFAETLAWSQRAAEYARSVQAHRQLQLALGNIGWAYQNLGDFDRALSHFQEAERVARENGLTTYRVLWLQDAGLAEYRLGNLKEAREYDEEALRTALKLPAEKEIDQIVN